MNHPLVETLDLHFMGRPGVIAAYLVRHRGGALLIETGPGSTQAVLEARLHLRGLEPRDISDVFLTHIHLDHAGAAGWLARQGARLHVHPNGAPHLANPDKLLASARRIYGDQMDRLWGEFLSVPPDRLRLVEDNADLDIRGLHLTALHTPGHAEHHIAYLFQDVLFTGDVGGIRLYGSRHVRVPVPPPEIHLGKWRASARRLREANPTYLAPTHFGLHLDVTAQLDRLERELDLLEQWLEKQMPRTAAELQAPTFMPAFSRRVEAFFAGRAEAEGLDGELAEAYQAAGPASMMAEGLARYWKKYRLTGENGVA